MITVQRKKSSPHLTISVCRPRGRTRELMGPLGYVQDRKSRSNKGYKRGNNRWRICPTCPAVRLDWN